ncbi:MAG: glycosyltransferase family 2 protein [Candidatus Omnitrophica bacterium]|nr:glycosyltransferase family 2 protein [Candidatus Omnitrophota bacterium]
MSRVFTDKKPRVSVITVCLNSEKYLERAIKSLLAQTYTNIEYIIIDGGSKDGTLKILNKYRNRIDCLISEADNGIYDAMNKGIARAGGDILYFYNSDDRLFDNDVIRTAVSFLDRKKTDFIYGDIVNDYEDNAGYVPGRYPRFITKRHFLRNTKAHSSAFFRRHCFKKVGGYNTRYKIVCDYEWFIRALYKNGLRCAHMKRIVSIFNCGGLSSIESSRAIIEEERASIQKLHFTPPELYLGKLLNFFLYGDIFRIAAHLILRNKGYRVLADFNKKRIHV